MRFLKYHSGFTLVELLAVMGILAVLFSVTILVYNPIKNAKNNRNGEREVDINLILKSVYDYSADHDGDFPPGVTTTLQEISNIGANICSAVFPSYLNPFPDDPGKPNSSGIRDCGSYNSGYQILKESSNRITVIAPLAENGKVIKVTR